MLNISSKSYYSNISKNLCHICYNKHSKNCKCKMCYTTCKIPKIFLNNKPFCCRTDICINNLINILKKIPNLTNNIIPIIIKFIDLRI
jgi:hypothetical protein